MRRLRTFIFFAASIVVAVGCNSILENEPGRLDRGASAGGSGANESATSDDADATEPVSGDAPGAGSGSTTGDRGGETDGGVDPDTGMVCSSGQKVCGGLCVSAADPFFGCSSSTCARCEVANGMAACLAGACGVAGCVPGFADCNALPADGCETNLQTVASCGACGRACPALKNATMACVAGTCTGTCVAGFGDCNGKVEDGCEKNLLKDKNNCGACGTHCVFGRCEQGVCVFGD